MLLRLASKILMLSYKKTRDSSNHKSRIDFPSQNSEIKLDKVTLFDIFSLILFQILKINQIKKIDRPLQVCCGLISADLQQFCLAKGSKSSQSVHHVVDGWT